MMVINDLKQKKNKTKIIALTAYDYSFARLVDEAGVDIILVGDSLGMVCLGYSDTKSVTMQDMLHHTRAVARGVKNALIIGDMPIGTYTNPHDAVSNAKLFIAAGAHAVKVEGCQDIIESIDALIDAGIPVMGHLGLMPQTAAQYKVQGKTTEDAKKIFDDALILDKKGVFSLLLECVPAHLAQTITETVQVPTIGIGAGRFCDGQILVLYDLLGLTQGFKPKFVRTFHNISAIVKESISNFRSTIEQGDFPSDQESFK